jgi:hypothetical protein
LAYIPERDITIMSSNRKDKNAWGISSMETYLTSIMIRKKRADYFAFPLLL